MPTIQATLVDPAGNPLVDATLKAVRRYARLMPDGRSYLPMEVTRSTSPTGTVSLPLGEGLHRFEVSPANSPLPAFFFDAYVPAISGTVELYTLYRPDGRVDAEVVAQPWDESIIKLTDAFRSAPVGTFPQKTLTGYQFVPITGNGGGGTGTVSFAAIQGSPSDNAALNTALNNREPAGTASTLISNHATATNPHSQYALNSSLTNYVTITGLASTLSSYVTNSSLTATLSGYATTSTLTTGLSGKLDSTAVGSTVQPFANSLSSLVTAFNSAPDGQIPVKSGTGYAFTPLPTGGGGGGGEANTASNIGTGGVGIFSGKIGVDLQFRRLTTPDGKLTASFNSTTNTVDLSIGTLTDSDIPSSIARTSALTSYATTSALTSGLAGKQNTLTIGNLTSPTGAVSITGGTGSVIGSGVAISIANATTSANGLMSFTDKTKIDGVASGATANSTDAFLLARANHTGSQAISTVSGLQTALDGKQNSSAELTGLTSLNTTGVVRRTGAGTYTASALAASDIPNLDASKITTGTFTTSQIPDLQTIYQPLNSNLTSIAALSTTSFGRSLLTQANATAAQTTLSLVPGTHVQAQATGKVNSYSGTTIVISATDYGAIVQSTGSASVTLTLPNDAAVGANFILYQIGTGQVEYAGGVTGISVSKTLPNGATLIEPDGRTRTAKQGAPVSFYVSSNTAGNNAVWVAGGYTA